MSTHTSNDVFITSDNIKTQVETHEAGYIELDTGNAMTSYAEMETSADVTKTVYVSESLPDGYTMVMGDDGQHYVTIVQDNQTYAIRLDEFHAMQQGGATTFAFQTPMPEEEMPPQVIVADLEPQPEPEPVVEPVQSPPVEKSSINSGIKWGMSSGPQPHMIPKATPKPDTSTVDVDQRTFKPIRIDNWGIFLLSRLQSYFQKKEHCDLTIRFPARNAQIKVHKLVVNACTDYFYNLERQGLVTDGTIDMPANFTPEAVAPIIRFMYTGRLDVKVGMFSKLHVTASLLQMYVLTKLMDAQVDSPIEPLKKGSKRRKAEDPVRQIKKIRRIERKFTEEERKQRIQQAKLEAQKLEANDTIPGKKLPIWKRKIPPEIEGAAPTTQRTSQDSENQHSQTITLSNEPITVNSAVVPSAEPDVSQDQLEGTSNHQVQSVVFSSMPDVVSSQASDDITSQVPDDMASQMPGDMASQVLEVDSENSSMAVVKEETNPMGQKAKSYGKANPESIRPKVPRQIREIQENLTFEKIRRTGTRNTRTTSSDEPARDMSVEEIREFMEEQRKRLAAMGDDTDDDDYYDNDAEIDYGDDLCDDDEPSSSSITTIDPITSAKPILKSTELNTSSLPRKSVRFSLRPTPKEIDSGPAQTSTSHHTPQGVVNQSITIKEVSIKPNLGPVAVPKKRGRPSLNAKRDLVTDSLDKTVDAFSKAVQEDELEESSGMQRPQMVSNSSQQHTPAKLGCPQPETSTPKPVDPKTKGRPNITSTPIQRKKHVRSRVQKSGGESQSQMQIVNEILKKHPELLAENKMVKLKVMSKDSDGKPVLKYITLRAQEQGNKNTIFPTRPAMDSGVATNSLGIKDIPKVCYTGKRGRPKAIKPGDFDPHEGERKKIEARLKKKIGSYGQPANQVQSTSASFPAAGSLQNKSSPSSEAEALSNLASGIATSLGLVSDAQAEFSTLTPSTSSGPLSDLERYHVSNAEQTIVSYDQEESAASINHLEKVDTAAKLKELAMDWDDDDSQAS